MKKWFFAALVIALLVLSSFVSGLVLKNRIEKDRASILAVLGQREKIGERSFSSGELSAGHEKIVQAALMNIQTLIFQKLIVKEDESLNLLRGKIDSVLKDIVRVSDNSENYQFTLMFIDSNQGGNFLNKGGPVGKTFGGGFIFLEKSIFKQAENEAALAGVIAHEVGHNLLQHSVKKDEYQRYLFLPFNLPYYFGSSHGLGASYGKIDGKREAQEQEEADIIAVQYLFKAGYGPGAYLELLRGLKFRYTKVLEKELRELEKAFPDQKLAIFRHMESDDFLKMKRELK